MSERSTLVDLKVTMKKHPDSLKLEGSLKDLLEKSVPLSEPCILYNGLDLKNLLLYCLKFLNKQFLVRHNLTNEILIFTLNSFV